MDYRHPNCFCFYTIVDICDFVPRVGLVHNLTIYWMVPSLNMQRNTIRVNRNLFFFQTLFQRDSWWEYPKGCSSILSHQFSLDRVHIREWTFTLNFRECDFIELSCKQNIGQVESSGVKLSSKEHFGLSSQIFITFLMFQICKVAVSSWIESWKNGCEFLTCLESWKLKRELLN